MTVFIDPVIGAALVAGLLPILPGLPCPTCGGRSEFRDDMFGSSPCPDCTDGVWTPPDHPVTIGVTSARPEVGAHDGYIVCSVIPKGYVPDYEADDDDFYEASGRGLMTNDEWAHKFDDISNHNPPHPIVLSSMIGSANLRALPIVDESEGVGPGVWVVPDRKSRGIYPKLLLATEDESAELVDISAALVFGKFEPGGVALYATDFTQSVECPTHRREQCPAPGCSWGEVLTHDDTMPCPVCGGQCFIDLPNHDGCPDCGGMGSLPCPYPVVDAPDHPCVQP